MDIIRFNGQQNEGTDHRTSLTGSVDLYQVLDRHTHAQLGATFTHQSGFLETAFNSVVIEDPSRPPNPVLDNRARGFEVTEELPDTRDRLAVFGKIRRHVGRLDALELKGRYYRDSWGAHSGSFDPRLYRWIVEEKLNAHGVDRAMDVLLRMGIHDAIVNAGGDMKVLGRDHGRPWEVAIKNPRDREAALAVLRVSNTCVVTSGDYERFFEIDGQRYHHILDPRTGYPSKGAMSATVVGPSAADADALATALCVLGPERGLPIVEKMARVEALLVDMQGKVWVSTGLKGLVGATGSGD